MQKEKKTKKRKSNIFVGLDLSLVATGFVALSEGKIVSQELVKSKPTDGSHLAEIIRIRNIVNRIEGLVLLFNPSFVAIEGIAFGISKTTALVQLGALNYMVRSRLVDLGIPFIIVSPPTLKKFVTGQGNAKKDQMMLATYQRFGESIMDNNLCDAFGLAQCVASVRGEQKITLNNEQQEVVNLLSKQII